MHDVNDDYDGRLRFFKVDGDNLDRVYHIALRHNCRALLDEYRAERAQRKALSARKDVLDFVVVGGIYDDVRVARPMHGAKAVLVDGKVLRYAGNPVFPNGTITVKFRDVPGAKVEIALAQCGSREYSCSETVEGGFRKIVIGKKGAEYPAILSVALTR